MLDQYINILSKEISLLTGYRGREGGRGGDSALAINTVECLEDEG